MNIEEVKDGCFYWIKYFDTITVGQYSTYSYGGSVGTLGHFDFVGSDEQLHWNEVEVLSEIPFPSFFVPGSEVTLYGEN